MRVIGDAGTYTPPDGGDPNHWVVHASSDYWPERTTVAASSMPRRASASARSLPGSPA